MLANAEDDDKVSSPRQSCEQSPSSRLADVINLFACIWQDRKTRQVRYFPSNNHHAYCSHRWKAQKTIFYRPYLLTWPRYLRWLCLLVSLSAFLCPFHHAESFFRYGYHLKARKSAVRPLHAIWHSRRRVFS